MIVPLETLSIGSKAMNTSGEAKAASSTTMRRGAEKQRMIFSLSGSDTICEPLARVKPSHLDGGERIARSMDLANWRAFSMI